MSEIETVRPHVSKQAAKNIEKWLAEPKYAEYKLDLIKLIDDQNWQELEDSFFKVVEFGTGGRRGTTGVGSNRINRVTIGESAQALCSYAASFDGSAPQKGVVIACDTRLTSPELSHYTAQVCAANGFKTYLFDGFRATPELSFAVRELGAAIGIVISASHNPPADNGIKTYWSDGGQLTAPHDKGILAVAATLTKINTTDYNDAIERANIKIIGSDIDVQYVAAAVAQAEGIQRDVNIIYSPLHGAGQRNVLPVLKAAGFENISLVEEQMIPDGNFPTVENGKPNPEERAANNMAVAQLLTEGADIAITNDPDADRIGVIGLPIYLSGNQSAVLATEYALRKKYEKNELTPKHYIAKTIVTTDMLTAIANKFGVQTYGNMLIGFKYISELIHQKENSDEVFVIGGEESYGLLKGDYSRDKDGATGALVLAEYAAELKTEDKTLYDRLLELYSEYGLYVERLDTVMCLGASGFDQMQEIMSGLRKQSPNKLNEHDVTAVLDYQTLERRDVKTGNIQKIDCPSGDIITLEFGDVRRRITIRPSGTEPKLKFYTQWFQEADNDIQASYSALELSLEGLSRELENLLLA